MRKYISLLLITIITLTVSSCYVGHSHRGRNLPPGQAKKVYGGKSAKKYAPGQQKKRHGKHGKGHHKHDVIIDNRYYW